MRYRLRERVAGLKSFYYTYWKKYSRSEYLEYYATPFFPVLDRGIISEFKHIRHTWKAGDKLYKLAERYYGDSTSWWIIALYNSKPTEAHIRNGEIILVPTPVGAVLARYGY